MNKLLYRTVGRFYLGESEQQAQYVFQFREDAPKELERSFIIGLEKDENYSGSALEVAYELQNIIDSYWINTYKPKIAAVVEYLERWQDKDHYDGLLLEKEKLTKRLTEVNSILETYDAEEMENWFPVLPEAIKSTE